MTESLVPRVLDTGIRTTEVNYYSWLIYPSYRINSNPEITNPSFWIGNSLNCTAKQRQPMLACLINGRRQAEITDVPVPRLQPGEVLIKLAAAGICGTDIEKVHGGYGPRGTLGHEVSGTIASVGDKVTDLKKSDRVIAHHHVSCYNCQYCQRGDHTMCDLFRKTNFDPCGLAEYFRVPETNVTRGAVIRLPSEASFEEGSMIEPTACCLRALNKAEVKEGDSVLVVGLGPTGLTQIQLLRKMNASTIIGADLLPHRLEMAHKLGANEHSRTRYEAGPCRSRSGNRIHWKSEGHSAGACFGQKRRKTPPIWGPSSRLIDRPRCQRTIQPADLDCDKLFLCRIRYSPCSWLPNERRH